jgi:hypothetical protein
VNVGAGSWRPKRNLARKPIAGRLNAPRKSDGGAGSGGASGAPLAVWRVAIRICFGNPPLLPLPPLITHHAARATEPETAGRMPRGVFGAETTGRIVASGELRHRYRAGSGRTERGNCRHLAMPNLAPSAPLPALLTRPVVAASWHPAIRQHYRGEFGAATPSARYRQRNRARTQRVSAP